jgi:hypothetical protein
MGRGLFSTDFPPLPPLFSLSMPPFALCPLLVPAGLCSSAQDWQLLTGVLMILAEMEVAALPSPL